MQTEKISLKTALVAHMLARAFGHEWAVLLSEADIVLLSEADTIDPERIREKVRAYWSQTPYSTSMVGGIDAPTVEDGEVVHTTGTRRTHWRVREGLVRFFISRPGDRMAVEGWAENGPGLGMWDAITYPSAGHRHVESAARIVSIIRGHPLARIVDLICGDLPTAQQAAISREIAEAAKASLERDREWESFQAQRGAHNPDVVKEVVERELGVPLLDVTL